MNGKIVERLVLGEIIRGVDGLQCPQQRPRLSCIRRDENIGTLARFSPDRRGDQGMADDTKREQMHGHCSSSKGEKSIEGSGSAMTLALPDPPAHSQIEVVGVSETS